MPFLTRFRATAASLCIALASAGCSGESSDGLPPFPAPSDAAVPVFDAETGFAVRLASMNMFGSFGDWRIVVGQEPWAWLGTISATGEAEPQMATQDLPQSTSIARGVLPDAPFAFAGDLEVFLRQVEPGILEQIRGAPAALQLARNQVPAPENELDGFLGAGLAAMGEVVVAALPRYTGRVEGALRTFADGGVFDLRFSPDPPISEFENAPVWYPPAPPEGLGLVRIEMPRSLIAPRYEEWLDRWDLPLPPEPLTDFTVEIHLLQFGEALGVMLALPHEWAPVEANALSDLVDTSLFNLEVESGGVFSALIVSALGSRFRSDDIESRVDVIDDALVLSMGTSGFCTALTSELGRSRPRPYAERRHRWPRYALGAALDVRKLQDAVRTALPIPIPSFGNDRMEDWILESVIAPENGTLRLRANWPKTSAEIAGFDLTEVREQLLPEIEAQLFDFIVEGLTNRFDLVPVRTNGNEGG